MFFGQKVKLSKFICFCVGMNDKNKKIVLLSILFIAIFSMIFSFFFPISSMNFSDALVKSGYEEPDIYWKFEYALFFKHYSIYDYRDLEKPSEFHRIFAFSDKFESGNLSLENEFIYPSFEEKIMNNVYNPVSLDVTQILFYIFAFFSLSALFFCCIKGYKTLNLKKSRYFLFLGIIFLIGLICFTILSYLRFDFSDVNNLGYASVMRLEIGFYALLLSGILFFVIHFLNNYFIKDSTNPKPK